jgi:hypothetical protein
MKWHEALSVWNRSKKEIDASHVWAVPRKGTPEYRAVYNIILRAEPAAVAERNAERNARASEQLAEIAKVAAQQRLTTRVAGAVARAIAANAAEGGAGTGTATAAPSVRERVEAIEERAAPKPVKVRRKAAPATPREIGEAINSGNYKLKRGFDSSVYSKDLFGDREREAAEMYVTKYVPKALEKLIRRFFFKLEGEEWELTGEDRKYVRIAEAANELYKGEFDPESYIF